MYSIRFPNMFGKSGAKTHLYKDHDATLSNLRLLLLSRKRTLFGDPFYGTDIIKVLFEQNNTALQDMVIDQIYETLAYFMPQLKVNRNDIKLLSDKVDLYCTISCVNTFDNNIDLYTIKLTEEYEEVTNGDNEK